MTLGTGIFLAALFLGTIFLYHSTKDRWNWLKGVKRIGLFILSLIVLGGGWWAYQANRDLFIPLEPYQAFGGIKLGAHQEDVLFLMGEPTSKGESKSKDLIWFYKKDASDAWTIVFDQQDTVKEILLYGSYSDILLGSYGSYDLYGIRIGSSLRKLTEKLGEPDEIETSDDKLRRFYKYKRLNARFVLTKGIVSAIAVHRYETKQAE